MRQKGGNVMNKLPKNVQAAIRVNLLTAAAVVTLRRLPDAPLKEKEAYARALASRLEGVLIESLDNSINL